MPYIFVQSMVAKSNNFSPWSTHAVINIAYRFYFDKGKVYYCLN